MPTEYIHKMISEDYTKNQSSTKRMRKDKGTKTTTWTLYKLSK